MGRCTESMNILSDPNFDMCNIDLTHFFDVDFEQDDDAFNIALPPNPLHHHEHWSSLCMIKHYSSTYYGLV